MFVFAVGWFPAKAMNPLCPKLQIRQVATNQDIIQMIWRPQFILEKKQNSYLLGKVLLRLAAHWPTALGYLLAPLLFEERGNPK